MFHLITTELIRILQRRTTLVVVAVSVLLVGLAGVTTFRSSSAAEADLAAAAVQAEQAEADCLASYADETYGMSATEIAASCQMNPRWFVQDEAFHMRELLSLDYAFDTEGVVIVPEWEQTREGHLATSTFTTMSGREGRTPAWGFNGTLTDLGATLTIVGALLAATWIGADWRSGVMENHLIREPRRHRLLGAKLVASSIASAAYVTLIGALLIVALLPSAIWRGDFAGTGSAFWVDVAFVGVRTAIAAALLALGAGAVAAVTRSTTVSAVTILGVAFFSSLAANVWHPLARFSMNANIAAWIDLGDVAVFREFAVPTGGTEGWDVVVHGWLGAGLLLVVGGAFAAVAGGAIFARRDVA